MKKLWRSNRTFLLARNNLALGCSRPAPTRLLRDGKRAVELILKDSEAAGETDPLLLRTLAAAYAQAGDFPEAVKTAEEALAGVEQMKNPGFIQNLQRELKLL